MPTYVINTITDTHERAQFLTNLGLIDAHTRALYVNDDIYPFLGLVFQYPLSMERLIYQVLNAYLQSLLLFTPPTAAMK